MDRPVGNEPEGCTEECVPGCNCPEVSTYGKSNTSTHYLSVSSLICFQLNAIDLNNISTCFRVKPGMMRLNFVYLYISVRVTITTTHMPPEVQELRPATPGEYLYVDYKSHIYNTVILVELETLFLAFQQLHSDKQM